jgi:two-component system LytT family response regulator
MMRVLIVDHEPVAQAALGRALAARSDVQKVDLANDRVEALDKLGKTPYDLLLLDTRTPELSGIDVLHRLKGRTDPLPSVVLVTPPDEQAVAVFKRNAVDFLLKPFSKDRVDEAVDVAVRRTAAERAVNLAEALPPPSSSLRNRPPIVAVKTRGRIVFVDLREVSVVRAEGNYVVLERLSRSDLLREPISFVAEKLRAYGFIQIHRSLLVNASLVDEIEVRTSGEYSLRMRGGKEYTVTRTYKKNLKSLAELWMGTDPFNAR